MSSAFEKEYLVRVRSLPCVLCGWRITESHHCCTGEGVKKKDLLAVPLCEKCHRPKGAKTWTPSTAEECAMILETFHQLARVWGPGYVRTVKLALLADRGIQKRIQARGWAALRIILEG